MRKRQVNTDIFVNMKSKFELVKFANEIRNWQTKIHKQERFAIPQI